MQPSARYLPLWLGQNTAPLASVCHIYPLLPPPTWHRVGIQVILRYGRRCCVYGRLSSIVSHNSADFRQKGLFVNTRQYKTCILNQITQYTYSSRKKSVVLMQPCTKSGRHVTVGTEYFRVGPQHGTSCRPSGAPNFEVTHIFLENQCPCILIIYVQNCTTQLYQSYYCHTVFWYASFIRN